VGAAGAVPPPEEGWFAVLRVDQLEVRFGGVTALDGPSFELVPGEVCGLIGPNGAGKTTLFDCVSRLTTPQAGKITFDGKDLLALHPHQVAELGIARTFQHLGLFRALSVRENVMLGGQHAFPARFGAAALRLPSVRVAERSLRARADEALDQLGLAHLASRPAAGLPYGTLKRIELARALAATPRLLLLDEPASGLTHTEVDALAELITVIQAERGLTVLLVEHHMGLVMRLSQKVVVLDFGRKIAEGTPDAVRENPAVIQAYLGASGNGATSGDATGDATGDAVGATTGDTVGTTGEGHNSDREGGA
jgi:branched-chain amino acid transport system ATP-binding protein